MEVGKEKKKHNKPAHTKTWESQAKKKHIK